MELSKGGFRRRKACNCSTFRSLEIPGVAPGHPEPIPGLAHSQQPCTSPTHSGATAWVLQDNLTTVVCVDPLCPDVTSCRLKSLSKRQPSHLFSCSFSTPQRLFCLFPQTPAAPLLCKAFLRAHRPLFPRQINPLHPSPPHRRLAPLLGPL